MDLWKQEVSQHIPHYRSYEPSEDLIRMASLFTPGDFYFYIVNFYDLRMEYVYPNVERILGVKPAEFDVKALLSCLPEAEVQAMQRKEAVASDFLFHHIEAAEIPNYKVLYCFKARVGGQLKTIMHQATALSVSNSGRVEHVLGIHTDVSHMNQIDTSRLSLVAMKGGPSYYNLDVSQGRFDHRLQSPPPQPLIQELTQRELEVLKLLARGFEANDIARALHVSPETIRTHRKNMLRKSDCHNTAELVAQCMVAGLL